MSGDGTAECDRVLHYYHRHADTATQHLVAEDHGDEVETACGRTLATKAIATTASAFGTGGWVADRAAGAVVPGDRCGTCPWPPTATDGGEDA